MELGTDSLGGFSRVTFRMTAAALAQEKVMQAIELIGSGVEPAVRTRVGAGER